ncbi:hypothetical protein AB0M28_34295 [Streptomyces sp. NPDC051940]|uniref:hypothetical protein n=1 Tax=Streptomyces sp. NPDC051940 TaxID=3155675 RepID=UPI0034463873
MKRVSQNRFSWLVPSGSTAAARTPFVLLVVALLGAGLIALLLLNAAVNQGAFELGEAKRDTTSLTEEEQRLQREIDAYAAPDALSRRAGELGMVPGGAPVFLRPDGKALGTPSQAPAPPAPTTPAPDRSESPASGTSGSPAPGTSETPAPDAGQER